MNEWSITHGLYRTPTYQTWLGMKQRCRRPTHVCYHLYGGRGIDYPDRWDSLENFVEDMGLRPPGMTLERNNNDLGYSKENCRWATHKEQMNNTRTNVFVTFNGVTKTIAQWAEEIGLSTGTLWRRFKDTNWTVEECLTIPKRKHVRHGT